MTTSAPHSRILARSNPTPVVDSLVPVTHPNASVAPSNHTQLTTAVIVVVVALVGLCTLVAVRHFFSHLSHPLVLSPDLDVLLLGSARDASGRRQAASSSLLDPQVGSMARGAQVDRCARRANGLLRRVLFVLGLSVPSLGAFLNVVVRFFAASRPRSVPSIGWLFAVSRASLLVSRSSNRRSFSLYIVFLFQPCNFLSCVSNY
jgi:hypothetical protein